MSNMLVTGGCGFIGAHLVKRLLDDGHTVSVIDDLSIGRKDRLPLGHERLRFHERSILDDYGPLLLGVDTVFHLAAQPRVQRSIADPEMTHAVNATGTLKLLVAARDARVRRFVFSSSSSVYGDQDRLPFEETMAPNPLSPYAFHKVIGEQYCRLFSALYGVSSVCLRYFNVYGPGMDTFGSYANLIPKFIALHRADQIPVINGDGEQTRDFTYVSDVVDANILAAGATRFSAGDLFNIGSGKSYTVSQVAGMIAEKMGRSIIASHGPTLIEPRATQADNSRARVYLKWKPTVDLDAGLDLVLAGG